MELIAYLLDTLIKFLGSLYPYVRIICDFIGWLISSLLVYQGIYFIIGLFVTRKFKKAKKKHKFAIVIAARNEEVVIGNLIDSIKKQDYPKELLTTFVVADNCTDKTAQIARSKGCICYERFNDEKRTKGYALEYLFDKIEEDYGRMSFEGYFVFDADNLLKKNYITKMNDAFDSGEKIITSYRNIKNIDENFITMSFAIHWLRSIRNYHRARSFLRLATNIQGTGYLFSSEIVRDGWHYTSLTEDRGLTADAVSQGYRISYQDEALFYDEQTPDYKVAYYQKLRWSKGLLINFRESGLKLFLNIFLGRKFVKNKWRQEKKEKWYKKIGIALKDRFIMFDTFMHLLPVSLIYFFNWILVSLIFYPCYCYLNNVKTINLFSGGNFLIHNLERIWHIELHFDSQITVLFATILIGIFLKLIVMLSEYLLNIVMPYIILFLERKRVKKIPFKKLIPYSLLWPIFDIVGTITTYIAVFTKVTWRVVPHNSKITIDDLEKN